MTVTVYILVVTMNLITYRSRLDLSEFNGLFHIHLSLITLGGRHTSG